VADRGLEVADIFVDRRLGDDEVAKLGKRVTVVADDGEANARFPDYYATAIEVTTRDGRTFTRQGDVARGNREAPLSEDELLAKFTALASSVAAPERVTALLACIAGLAEAPGLGELADLLG
jgi:2-methylcitrate dehydratase PrpD